METKRKPLKPNLYQKKMGFKTKTVIIDKEEHHIMIKRSKQQEDIIFTNIYAPTEKHLNI